MTDTDDTAEPGADKPTKTERAKKTVMKTAEVADKASNVAEVANNAFGAVKWVSIAVVALVMFSIAYGGYKMITRPVAAVTEAAGTVVEKVGDGAGAIADKVGDSAGAVKEGASNVINRLVIPATDQSRLDSFAEAAFPVLFSLDKTKPDGVKERMFRRTNFGGSDGRVCKFMLDFGGGPLDVFAAADIDEHKTEASLGSKKDRLLRMVIRANDDDIMFNTQWDEQAQNWIMKWKRTTVSKPLGDKIAEARLLDILTAVPNKCP